MCRTVSKAGRIDWHCLIRDLGICGLLVWRRARANPLEADPDMLGGSINAGRRGRSCKMASCARRYQTTQHLCREFAEKVAPGCDGFCSRCSESDVSLQNSPVKASVKAA